MRHPQRVWQDRGCAFMCCAINDSGTTTLQFYSMDQIQIFLRSCSMIHTVVWEGHTSYHEASSAGLRGAHAGLFCFMRYPVFSCVEFKSWMDVYMERDPKDVCSALERVVGVDAPPRKLKRSPSSADTPKEPESHSTAPVEERDKESDQEDKGTKRSRSAASLDVEDRDGAPSDKRTSVEDGAAAEIVETEQPKQVKTS